MTSVSLILETFQSRIRQELPQLMTWPGKAEPDGFGNYIVLDAPWPSKPDRCRLEVLFRGDCFQVAFYVAETRGPAEQVIISDDPDAVVSATIEFRDSLVAGRILVDVSRSRFLWFAPYYLVSFRQESQRPGRRVVETISWRNAA
jgi:hypothetical protein